MDKAYVIAIIGVLGAIIAALLGAIVQAKMMAREEKKNRRLESKAIEAHASDEPKTSRANESSHAARALFVIAALLVAVSTIVVSGGLDLPLLRAQLMSILASFQSVAPAPPVGGDDSDCPRVTDAVLIGTNPNVCSRRVGDLQYRWRGQNWCVHQQPTPQSYLCNHNGVLGWQNPPGF